MARPKARRQTELNASSLGRDGCAIVAWGGERLYGLVRPGLGLRPRVASSSFAVRCHRSGAPRRARCHSRQAPRKEFLAELASGRTKDQNIGYIAEYLTAVGIDLKEVRVVGDEEISCGVFATFLATGHPFDTCR